MLRYYSLSYLCILLLSSINIIINLFKKSCWSWSEKYEGKGIRNGDSKRKSLTPSTCLVTGILFSMGFDSPLYYTNICYVSIGYIEDLFLEKVYDYNSISILSLLISGSRLK